MQKYSKECSRMLVGASLNNLCALGLLCVARAQAELELGYPSVLLREHGGFV